ncbi:MAG: triosephosphate isomerase [Deltaproteobacteria bacterium]|jgi:triosephosphate isomerase|nr:MAG: triosephosphate isomerase [Deltaproteobacteria bacterium]
MRKRLIVGNWKMNMLRKEAYELARGIAELVGDVSYVDIAVAPPYTSLDVVYGVISNTNIGLCAQNVFWEEAGAFTGEISPYMLIDAGCKWVIVGHSERRTVLGETDEMVKRKVAASIKAGLIPILCVGETLEQRESGKTMEVIRGQLERGLDGIELFSSDSIVIAYEPVWAIGTGRSATPYEAEEVHLFIRNVLDRVFEGIGGKIRVLYGGSVTPENIEDILSPPNIDGVLVGGASLKAESFARIVRLAGRIG